MYVYNLFYVDTCGYIRRVETYIALWLFNIFWYEPLHFEVLLAGGVLCPAILMLTSLQPNIVVFIPANILLF